MSTRTTPTTEVKLENTTLEAAAVQAAPAGYDAPRIVTHSASKMNAAVLPVNACGSNIL